ncbi:SDR family oxidoreductase [Pseudomonas monteilii]|uniref:UDP-glucose 4-epimerase family protein n=1 Tax=Pseudomonas TaxID=286 RepID=UPI0002F5D14A|nr:MULTISPECIES: NAD-dependent epimerase/dehydratase family protein [Pseudomonas]MBH3453582.1 SDR family oxidoreductase [Pseudomonas monteilii]PXX65907.1 UDP-glucose 4-epimerase [Pseudomonas sp. LAIL14HWK12:I1]SOC97983.1 UDP-glucose 4-epimerase [Pseudomonas sp. LAIL14HWK12:I3]
MAGQDNAQRPAVLTTGGSGFVGKVLLQRLAEGARWAPRALVRQLPARQLAGVDYRSFSELTAVDVASGHFEQVDTVIHLASRVHVMHETAADPLAEFRRVNVEGTLSLARAAAQAGVRRFIFVSSVKVNGETTDGRLPFTADETPAPSDPYGISKREAEEGLRQLAAQTGLEVVIVRPVLVYGPGVKANFRSMMNWLSKGVPLPFGAIHNKRSLVALDNLVDLLVTCIDHPAAANQTFLASDGHDLSTTELLQRLGKALGKPARLLPVPAAWLKGAATLAGKGGLAQRLCGSLQVDSGKARTLLGWQPPLDVDQALRATALNFLKEQDK